MKKNPTNHLAEGESTGHFHAAEGAVVYLDGETKVFDASKKSVKITHQEHKPIVMPAKKMRSGQVREYDYFAEEARTVVD